MRKVWGALLLGVGIGLLLSAGVLLGQDSGTLTRTQLISQAREIGMVFPEEVVVERPRVVEVPATTQAQTPPTTAPVPTPPATPAPIPAVPAPAPRPPVQVVIPPGSVASRIGQLLEDAGVVDRQAFIKRVTDEGLANRLRAGTYTFPHGVNLDQVMEILIR